MLLNHQSFFSGPVHFARWASVTAAELCSFAGDHHTNSFCRRRRLLMRLNQSTDNQGGKVINQPTGRRKTSVWSVLNQGKSAIIGTNFTDWTLPVWPLTGFQSSHTCDSTYEHFNCRYGQKSCKNNPQSHKRKYCSEEGKWWKTKLPLLNQHLPGKSTYVRASIWPKSNTPTYCRIRLQTVASEHRYPANRCTPHQKHAEPIRAWAHPAEAGSVCTYSAAAEGAAHSSTVPTTTFPTSQVCFPTSMRQTWLQPLSEHQSGLILRTLQHSRPTASCSMMPYSLPSCWWCRTYFSLSYRKWRCIITKITASSSEWDCTHRCTASSHFR